jgi:glycosyltransferase involved in cell wall biosynthesis
VKISVLSFDLSDNATGRAELIARLLAPRHDVTVVGPIFGAGLWNPLAGSPLPHRGIRARRYPRFVADVGALLSLIDGDLIYACKPRPTSFGIGLLARRRPPRPLVLDIDDWELGFFSRGGAWGRLGRALNFGNPNGLPWTWLCERLVDRADAITVASRFLERRFGGTFVPHARDTDAWDPARHDGSAVRATLAADGRAVVMFLGTPRGYKGVDDLVEAVGSLADRAVLAIVGVKPGSDAARRWAAHAWVRVVGEIPFEDVPRHLMAADVVAVPQRATSDTVGQVPAKLFDAMALARPVVATAVSMIPEILAGSGVVVPPGDAGQLARGIARLLDDPAGAAALGQRARERCIAEYSFAAARARLWPLVEEVADRHRAACHQP